MHLKVSRQKYRRYRGRFVFPGPSAGRRNKYCSFYRMLAARRVKENIYSIAGVRPWYTEIAPEGGRGGARRLRRGLSLKERRRFRPYRAMNGGHPRGSIPTAT